MHDRIEIVRGVMRRFANFDVHRSNTRHSYDPHSGPGILFSFSGNCDMFDKEILNVLLERNLFLHLLLYSN